MRLRRLEIAGFKSVARKTVLSFPGAITCIAGPNGCGKSNIVDAIRWALGEQSPKALRAPSMEDIIFSGTQGLPPSGMARVSLEFTRDGDYFPKTLDGFDEISIARSLYRTGESVYTLNHVKCRLKDITDIFLDTGLDRRGYAIIEQGKIKDIINSDPEEIRYLVEEVAEVGRLRYKKAEASRRLKATQSNLVRIQDLLSEVSRQRDDLRAQANKAKRYQKLNNSLNSMTRELWAFELRQLGIAREKLEHRLFELRESKEKKTKEIKSRLDLLQKLEKELKQGGRRLKQLEASVLKARATLDSTGSSIAILNSRLTELGTEMRRLSEDIKASTKRDLAQRQEAAKLKKDIYHATKEISNVEHIVVSRQTDIQRLKNEYRKVLEEYEDKRARLFDLSGRQKALEQDLISTRSRMKEAVKASGQKQAELDEMKSSKERARAEMSSLEDKRRVLDKNLERIETRLGDLEERQLRLVRELDNLIKILRENEKVYSELNVKISMLDRMIAEGLGVPGDNDIEHRTGTKRVADSIRVKPGYEDAVGRSIGDGLGYVVVESYDQVRELIKERKAELGFVPLKPNVSNGDMGKIPEVAEILGPLRNYIDVASDFNEVVEALASGMVVVKGIEDAMRLWEKGYRSVTMVSLDGKVLEPTGVIRCNVEGKRYASGLRARSERENLLRQKDLVRADMRVLDGKIAIKRAEVDAIIQEIEGERKRRQDTRIELERITMEIGEARLRLKAITGDIGKAEVDIESWDDMVKRLSNELEQKESSKQGLDSELDDLRIELTTLGGKKDELYNKMADEEHLLEKESARMRDMKISLARMEERVNAINEEISRKSGNLDEMKHMIKDLAVQLRSNRQRLGILSRQKGEAESTILEMEAERDNLRAGYKKLEERIGLLEKEIQSLTAEVERLKKQENEYLLEHRERDISYSMLLQRLESRFGKKELRLPEGFDPEVTKQKMARIQRRIENMGQINFVALEAFEDAQSRWERLHVQYQDLSQAMERLQQVINNLEKQSSRRFLSTFEKVRANFRDIFGMLFNGGKADLVLASLGDAGQGIEIKASPPFKRIKNMSLLSDGEKVLCAISFVFSLFKVRPSPFCVLDEVDASLDEANTLRFNRLIKAYSKDTQFIMITHNKHTMEIADIIYGVTFDTPGVSKVVAMDLKEMDE